MSKALVQEVKAAVQLKYGHSSAIQALLAAGVDVNIKDGASVCWAVSDLMILDIILSRRPTSQSLSTAVPLAMTFPEPVRWEFCMKLLQAGAHGEEKQVTLHGDKRG